MALDAVRSAPAATAGTAFAFRLAWLPGAAALLFIVGVVGLALSGLAAESDAAGVIAALTDGYVLRVAMFTIVQAALSTAFALALALSFARAAARRPDWRPLQWAMRLGGLAFVTPVIIGVFGVVEIHGVTGWLNAGARALGGSGFGAYIYGLPGILIAHIFFNMPFAARNFDRALAGVAPESWRLAAQLGMSPGQVFRLIEWPALASVFLPTAAIVFALCFTSFAVVAVLGGGPRATILEVAIYQALRFEFDIGRAVGLAFVQILLAAALTGPLLLLARSRAEATSFRGHRERPDVQGGWTYAGDIGGIALFILAVALPMLGIVLPAAGALSPERLADPTLWRAAGWSLTISVAAGGIAFSLGLGLALTMREFWPRAGMRRAAAALEAVGAIILVAPPLLIGAGLFLAMRNRVDLFASAPLLVIAVNSLSSLPFVVRLLGPELARAAERDDRLAASLGLAGAERWRLIDWPAIRRPAATALAIAIAMAAGDLGVIALFGSPETTTLPLLIYQRMGAYRMDDAAVGIMVLIALSLLVFIAAEALVGGIDRQRNRSGRRHA